MGIGSDKEDPQIGQADTQLSPHSIFGRWHLTRVLKSIPASVDSWRDVEPNCPLDTLRRGRHDLYTSSLPIYPADPSRSWLHYRARLALYEIFSPSLMGASIYSKSGQIELDAIIVQRVYLGPFATEMAVKVIDVDDREFADGTKLFGFSYITLTGHSEKGEARFAVEQKPTGGIDFTIESWSTQGTLLARIGAAVARIIQTNAVNGAIRNLAGSHAMVPHRIDTGSSR
jgi:hypothetical protein